MDNGYAISNGDDHYRYGAGRSIGGDEMTDAELLKELGSDTPLNRARRLWRAKIEQAGEQSPIRMRKMEFEAVTQIVAEYNK